MSIPTDENGRPVMYILQDAQTELMLSRSWRWTKRLLPERYFRHTKLALANWILAEVMTAVQVPMQVPPDKSEERDGH